MRVGIIPKNSTRIPLVGGTTYSPDFAYVVKRADGKVALNLVVETKDKTELDLGGGEAQRIKYAEAFFNQLGGATQVHFKKQLSGVKMLDLIEQIVEQG